MITTKMGTVCGQVNHLCYISNISANSALVGKSSTGMSGWG